MEPELLDLLQLRSPNGGESTRTFTDHFDDRGIAHLVSLHSDSDGVPYRRKQFGSLRDTECVFCNKHHEFDKGNGGG